ncbi:MAG TPA: methyltransferase [Herpetosiphonaceae bacterium]
MVNGIGRSALMLLVIGLFFITDLLMAWRFDRLRTADGSSQNWGYMLFALILGGVLLVQPVIWPWLGIASTALWGLALQVLGLGLALAALAINAWSRAHLGVWYAQRGEIQPGHQLITTGPYATVRHPIFSSYFLLTLGLALVNPSVLMLVVLGYTLGEFTRNAHRDEQLLLAHFPAYHMYMQQTGRFWPRSGRRQRDPS